MVLSKLCAIYSKVAVNLDMELPTMRAPFLGVPKTRIITDMLGSILGPPISGSPHMDEGDIDIDANVAS